MASLEPGGTRGGIGLFVGGIALTGISMWFFLDSVRVQSYGNGWISSGFGGFGGTGSMGVLFLLMLGGFAAGIGLTLRSLKPTPPDETRPDHLSEIAARNK